MKQTDSLSLLGSAVTTYPESYSPEILEAFTNKDSGDEQWVSFVCPEFTSLCPMTKQPDFARIYINYIADAKLVESKSLKLYLFSFRNKGDFHENCIKTICNDLKSLISPLFIEVIGEFTPRGGISIFPYSSSSNGSKEFEALRRARQVNYSPGKFSLPLMRG